MRQKSICRRLMEEDSRCRMYLLLWILLVSVVIGLIWQIAEVILYKEVQGRAVDDIIGIVYASAMVMAYFLGRDDENEMHKLSGHPDGRTEFHFDPATQKLLLQALIMFPGHKEAITVTVPCGAGEAELIKSYTDAYLELLSEIEKAKEM